MKTMKTLLAAGIAAATFAAPAMAELEASAAVSNIYLFRGVDQGNGNGAVSGDLTYSNSGFYAGLWASSANGAGEEIDTFLGWSGEFGGLGVDIGAINYYYPSNNQLDSWGTELTEAYLGLSFAGLEFYYYDNVAGNNAFGTYSDDGAVYYTLGYSMGSFSALVGMYDPEEVQGQTYDDDYVHVDLTYAFNDNLSFTYSQIVDSDNEAGLEEDGQIVVTYSLPIK